MVWITILVLFGDLMVQSILEGSMPSERRKQTAFDSNSFSFPLSRGSEVEAVFGLLADVVPVFSLLLQQFFQFLVNYQSSSVSFFGMESNFSFCGFLYNG